MTEQTLSTPIERRAPETGTLVSSLRAVYIIWYRDVIRYMRDRFRLVASLAQPLLYLVIFGTGLSSSLRGAGGAGFGGGQTSADDLADRDRGRHEVD